MTLEERDTARAIQTIARKLRESDRPKEIDWEQRRYEISKDMMAAFLSNSLSMSDHLPIEIELNIE